MNRPLPIALAVIGLLTSSCARSPEKQVYTLREPATHINPANLKPASETLAILSLTIPESVDRQKMVTRSAGSARLELSDTHRWAEPLTAEIATALADEIVLERPGTLVTTPGQVSTAQHPDHQLDIDITRFEGVLGGGVDVEAIWTIRDFQGKQEQHRHARIHEETDGAGHEAVATAYARALRRLAHQMIASLEPTK